MTDDKTIRVIAAVVTLDSKYLVCKRPENKRHGNLWEFPGGKMRDGESHFDAAKRELYEELQVKVSNVGEHLFTSQDTDSIYSIEFIEVKIWGEPKPTEHSEVRWCNVNDMRPLKFAPADTVFINDYLMRKMP